VNLSNYL